MTDIADQHQHLSHTPTWFKCLIAVIILLGLLSIPGYWLLGRWRHHQAIEELRKVPAFEVDVVIPDSGFKGWVCRRFDGKGAFVFEKVGRIFARYRLSSDKRHLLELFPEVTWLNIGCNSITDAELSYLSGLSNLQRLFLSATNITDAGLVHLSGLSNLKVLALAYTNLAGAAGLTHLSGLSNLQMLVLDKTNLTDAGLAHLSGLSNLQLLGLGRTNITDAGLVHLSGLSNLQELRLVYTKITDAGLVHLSGLSNLKKLDLSFTPCTKAGIERLKKKIPGLQVTR